MKIGILTMNYRYNYGGILQCVALGKVLEQMGYEVEVIRFSAKDKDTVTRRTKLFFSGLSLGTLGQYVHDIACKKITKLFANKVTDTDKLLAKRRLFVEKNINYTELCDEDSIDDLVLNHKLDAIVIGSDKIWGGLSGNRLVYFGECLPRFKGKIISYAACSSCSFIPTYNVQKIHILLKRFAAISVRDTHTKSLFDDYKDIEIKIVLDPVFLYDFSPYLKKQEKEPYVFVYILGRKIKGGHEEMIRLIRRKYGNIKTKAIVLFNENTDIASYVDEVIYDASPAEWVNMLYNAAFVYTDSFHGVAFSLKFAKPFVAYYRESSRATRLVFIRDQFHLEKSIVSSVKDAINKETITTGVDYDSVSKKIEEMKMYSSLFLENSLK